MMGYADFCKEAYKLALGADLAAKETLVRERKSGWSCKRVWDIYCFVVVVVVRM